MIHMLHFRLGILFILLFVGLCCKDGIKTPSNSNIVDLLGYGIPFELAAPVDAQVRESSSGSQKNIFVSHGKNYDVHIAMSEAILKNIESLKAQKKVAMSADPYFLKIIEEVDAGFIYEKEYGDIRGYDFYLVKIQGNYELSFQCGSGGIYSEQDVKRMFNSVLAGF